MNRSSAQTLALDKYLQIGGKLLFPELVTWPPLERLDPASWDEKWEEPFKYSGTSSEQDIALILGIKPQDSQDERIIWEDVYSNVFAYYYLGFAVFVVYNHSPKAIRTSLSLFSNYIKKRIKNIGVVSLIICGDYDFTNQASIDISTLMKDLFHDLNLVNNSKTNTKNRQGWFIKLRPKNYEISQKMDLVTHALFTPHYEDPSVDSVYLSTSLIYTVKTPIPIVLWQIIPKESQLPKEFQRSESKLHNLLHNLLLAGEILDFVWLLCIPLDLARSFEEHETIIKKIVEEQKDSDEKFKYDVERFLQNAPEIKKQYYVLLSCWSIIKWKIAQLPEEREEILNELFDYMGKYLKKNLWNTIVDLIGCGICVEITPYLLQHIPKIKIKRDISWEFLKGIIEKTSPSETKQWKDAIIALLNGWEFTVVNEQTTDVNTRESLKGTVAQLETRIESLEQKLETFVTEQTVTTTIKADKQNEDGESLATKQYVNSVIEDRLSTYVTDAISNEKNKKEDEGGIATKPYVTSKIDQIRRWQLPLFLVAVLFALVIVIILVVALRMNTTPQTPNTWLENELLFC